MDDKFVQAVWRPDMSDDELQRLLDQHFKDVDKIRKNKQQELAKHQKKLMEKLKNRLRQRTEGSGDEEDESVDGQESDVEEEEFTVEDEFETLSVSDSNSLVKF